MSDVKILVVEDEAIVMMELQKMLKSWGYSVLWALSGEEAVKQAFEVEPNLVLMDIALKGEIDGIEVAHRIKDLDIPVIYITAMSSKEIVECAMETKPYAYLTKPFDGQKLQMRIKRALKSQSRKENSDRYP